MNPVNTALWYVESHFASNLTLEEIARHERQRKDPVFSRDA